MERVVCPGGTDKKGVGQVRRDQGRDWHYRVGHNRKDGRVISDRTG